MATDLIGRRCCGVRETKHALRVFGFCVCPGAYACFARVACAHKRGVALPSLSVCLFLVVLAVRVRA